MKLISAEVMDQYMRFRGETNRSLATKIGKSPALVAHLRRGARNYCAPEVGPRIEKALNAPPGSLFLAEVHGALPRTTQRIA
ncbi:hypothetical protein AB0K45_11785 [Micrococcus luteus]|uniref:hypothetical protein n=1 Tax=Micrococcus luteus TaxID=1270 RepID=UPI0034469A89